MMSLEGRRVCRCRRRRSCRTQGVLVDDVFFFYFVVQEGVAHCIPFSVSPFPIFFSFPSVVSLWRLTRKEPTSGSTSQTAGRKKNLFCRLQSMSTWHNTGMVYGMCAMIISCLFQRQKKEEGVGKGLSASGQPTMALPLAARDATRCEGVSGGANDGERAVHDSGRNGYQQLATAERKENVAVLLLGTLEMVSDPDRSIKVCFLPRRSALPTATTLNRRCLAGLAPLIGASRVVVLAAAADAPPVSDSSTSPLHSAVSLSRLAIRALHCVPGSLVMSVET